MVIHDVKSLAEIHAEEAGPEGRLLRVETSRDVSREGAARRRWSGAV